MAAARMLDWIGGLGSGDAWQTCGLARGVSVLALVVACPQAKRLGGRGYVRLGGWGRRQEAGGRRRRTCVRLLEAEKCPLQSQALAAGTFLSGRFAR